VRLVSSPSPRPTIQTFLTFSPLLYPPSFVLLPTIFTSHPLLFHFANFSIRQVADYQSTQVAFRREIHGHATGDSDTARANTDGRCVVREKKYTQYTFFFTDNKDLGSTSNFPYSNIHLTFVRSYRLSGESITSQRRPPSKRSNTGAPALCIQLTAISLCVHVYPV